MIDNHNSGLFRQLQSQAFAKTSNLSLILEHTVPSNYPLDTDFTGLVNKQPHSHNISRGNLAMPEKRIVVFLA